MSLKMRDLGDAIEASRFVLGIKDNEFMAKFKLQHARNHVDLVGAFEPYVILEKEARSRILGERNNLAAKGKTDDEIDGIVEVGGVRRKLVRGLIEPIDQKEFDELQKALDEPVEFVCKTPILMSDLLANKDGAEREVEGMVILNLIKVGLLAEG